MNVTDQLRGFLERTLSVRGIASRDVQARFDASVIRPIRALLSKSAKASLESGLHASEPDSAKLNDMLWEITKEATSLYNSAESVELFEATAALQDLVCRSAESEALELGRVDDIRKLVGDSPAVIKLSPNGPLLVKNVARFLNWRYEPLPLRPLMALCRCGASSMKPFCDGSHFNINFQDAKDPRRVPDSRDTYVGQQVTILAGR